METFARYYDIIYNSDLPFLKLDASLPHELIFDELSSISSVQLRAISGWNGFALHGIHSHKALPHTDYGYKSEDQVPYSWTEISQQCPLTVSIIKKMLPLGRFYRVKVNILEPQSLVPYHRDSPKKGLGLTKPFHSNDPNAYSVKYISFAIKWPKPITYDVGGYRLPIEEGDIFLVDFSRIHRVFNASNEDRYLLLVTGEFDSDPGWRELVIRSYEKYKDTVIPKSPKILLLDKFIYFTFKRLFLLTKKLLAAASKK